MMFLFACWLWGWLNATVLSVEERRLLWTGFALFILLHVLLFLKEFHEFCVMLFHFFQLVKYFYSVYSPTVHSWVNHSFLVVNIWQGLFVNELLFIFEVKLEVRECVIIALENIFNELSDDCFAIVTSLKTVMKTTQKVLFSQKSVLIDKLLYLIFDKWNLSQKVCIRLLVLFWQLALVIVILLQKMLLFLINLSQSLFEWSEWFYEFSFNIDWAFDTPNQVNRDQLI